MQLQVVSSVHRAYLEAIIVEVFYVSADKLISLCNYVQLSHKSWTDDKLR